MGTKNENYSIAGIIPEYKARKLGMKETTPIWISDYTKKHIGNKHKVELMQRKTTAFEFVHKVVSNFNNAFRQDDGTIILTLGNNRKRMVTYIKLQISKENFWRVKSAHIRDEKELERYQQIYP